MANKFRLKGVYGKPIAKNTPLEDQHDRTKLLEEVGREAIMEIQKEIRRMSFKGQPTELLNSFSFKVTGKSTLVIESDHPAAKYLNSGVKAYQMTHLTKANRPIPIVKDNGELVFRNATPKSMQEGKWQHPGFKGKHFLERGIEKARDKVKEKISGQIKDEVKKRLMGGK